MLKWALAVIALGGTAGLVAFMRMVPGAPDLGRLIYLLCLIVFAVVVVLVIGTVLLRAGRDDAAPPEDRLRQKLD